MTRTAVLMLGLLLLSTPLGAADATDDRVGALADFHQQLKRAAAKNDAAFLSTVFAGALAATDEPSEVLSEIRRFVLKDFRGRGEYSCRGRLCAIAVKRGTSTSTLHLTEAPQGSAVHFVAHEGRAALALFAEQISLSLTASGGGVRVLLNGARTYAVDDVQDTSTANSMLNDALVPGRNDITLVPLEGNTGPVSVTLGVGGHPGDIVDTALANRLRFHGDISAPVTLAFDAAPAGQLPPWDLATQAEVGTNEWLTSGSFDGFAPWKAGARDGSREALLAAGVTRVQMLGMELELTTGSEPPVELRTFVRPRHDGPELLFASAREASRTREPQLLEGANAPFLFQARSLLDGLTDPDCPAGVARFPTEELEEISAAPEFREELTRAARKSDEELPRACTLLAAQPPAPPLWVKVDDVALIAFSTDGTALGVVRAEFELMDEASFVFELGQFKPFVEEAPPEGTP
jgi:hypothetical protein